MVFNTTSTSTADRIIQVTVNDGNFDSNIGTTLMHVVANVPPALNLDADSSTTDGVDYLTTFTDGGPAVAIVDTDVLVTDSDDTELTSATVTLTNPDTDDVLVFNGTPPLGITASVYDPGTGILTLTGPASLAAFQTALQQIRFDNTGTTPSTDTRYIDVVVNDGTAASNLAQAIIHVAQVNNNAPVVNLDADDFDSRWTELQRHVHRRRGADSDRRHRYADHRCRQHDSCFGDHHADGPTDRRSADRHPAVAGRYYRFRLRPGHRNPDALQRRLARRLRDGPGSDPLQRSRRESVAGSRFVEVVVNDGANNSEAATAVLTVVAVNDAPVLVVADAIYQEDVPRYCFRHQPASPTRTTPSSTSPPCRSPPGRLPATATP